MCFSAGASFGAAAILGVAGVAIVKKVNSPSQLMFASMPLLFALQQVSEGFEWLSFNNPTFEHLRIPMMYLFLFFAQILWPSWVPISIMVMERDPKRKKALACLTVLGLIGSSLLAFRLIYFNVESDIEGHHIHYGITSPQWIVIASSILYFVSTLVSPLISSYKHMKGLGLIMLTALLVTQLFYEHYLVSVWCFFSALLSVVIYMVLRASQFDRSHIHSILRSRIHPGRHNPSL